MPRNSHPSTPQIFEDPAGTRTSQYLHGESFINADNMLRRGTKENELVNAPALSTTASGPCEYQNMPLGERHLNSPSKSSKVPLKDETSSRPTHRKTNSAASIKAFIRGKEKKSPEEAQCNLQRIEANRTPQKKKSSTNLSGLLRKRSRKDLGIENIPNSAKKENIPPRTSIENNPSEPWSQAACSSSNVFSIAQRNDEYTTGLLNGPKSPPKFDSTRENIDGVSGIDPPRRPFLEHRSSRSSIFTECLEEDNSKPVGLQKNDMAVDQVNEVSVAKAAQPQLAAPPQQPQQTPKRSSRVWDAVATFNRRSQRTAGLEENQSLQNDTSVNSQDLDVTFEKVLDSLNIPQNMRENMRNLKPDVKIGLIKGNRVGSGSSLTSTAAELPEVRSSARSTTREVQSSQGEDVRKHSRSRSRPRSRILTLSKRDDASPAKKESSFRPRSKSRPRSVDMSAHSKAPGNAIVTTGPGSPDSTSVPGDFIHYLREVQKPELVDVGKVHKLRILLRNETVSWTNAFVNKGGFEELVQLLQRTMQVEWREEHEDALLHETLLCLKALCTTSLALQRLAAMDGEIFPALLSMLFDEEKKGPSEFATRSVIIFLVFAHLTALEDHTTNDAKVRAQKILSFLQDQTPTQGSEPLGFISQMHVSRPYRTWCREVVNVTKEVFWIFLHHLNVVPVVEAASECQNVQYQQRFFPGPRAPHPAAPYVGGVEWEATQYLSTHLDLLSGLIASFPTSAERNALREDLKQSGWEKVMGGTLRTCKEKFYGCVHDGLKLWVTAAKEDGWLIEDVRAGPPREAMSPKKSPTKKKLDEAPKLALNVDMGVLSDAWV